MIVIGMMTSFWVGYYLSMALPSTINWRWMFGLGAVPAVILVALSFFLPGSPRWLLIQGREEDAKKALVRLGIHIKEHIIPPKREMSLGRLFRSHTLGGYYWWLGFGLCSSR